ncbi:SGNH hydrolase-type esterase domain-containing protein [Lobosporangium transversale]|uniref:SGNH hydrolase-type esterase domain-containing protein n=1 Tax=Lobosporangium transversale TaxID=64571 RepID=A0A1Y2H2H0_9FUNG|nr:SGNH hydrolase-type esterase domain-containing protein [Lobosporangium transversale]ORZ28748.1 SGNH hydrolase-type esterase domain-containing protein [Lobosporangium transversale]|eukprot:XP_021886421.1 SGNH hydrolase-type esterase domain-containing protein [Lobosporangium transversale]
MQTSIQTPAIARSVIEARKRYWKEGSGVQPYQRCSRDDLDRTKRDYIESTPTNNDRDKDCYKDRSSPEFLSSSSKNQCRLHRDQEQQESSNAMVQQVSYDQFILFGDSITQYSFDVNQRGYGSQLAHLFQRRLDVINRGFSGYTSEQAIHLLPQFLPRPNDQQQQLGKQEQEQGQEQAPQLPTRLQLSSSLSPSSKVQFLSIFFGANDACLPPSPQHVDLERYEQNLRSLIDMVHDPRSLTYSPETRVIIICPPVIDEERWAKRRQKQGRAMDREKGVTKKYAATCLKVGQEYQCRNDQQSPPQYHQVDVIDTWSLMTTQIESGQRTLQDYLIDGLHLASEGNNLIFEEIMKIIRSRYQEWDPEVMPMHAPWWGHLDLKQPEIDLLICANKTKKEL